MLNVNPYSRISLMKLKNDLFKSAIKGDIKLEHRVDF